MGTVIIFRLPEGYSTFNVDGFTVGAASEADAQSAINEGHAKQKVFMAQDDGTFSLFISGDGQAAVGTETDLTKSDFAGSPDDTTHIRGLDLEDL